VFNGSVGSFFNLGSVGSLQSGNIFQFVDVCTSTTRVLVRIKKSSVRRCLLTLVVHFCVVLCVEPRTSEAKD
jgi:hypothetical protein